MKASKHTINSTHINDSQMDALLAQAFAVREVQNDSLESRLENVRRQHRIKEIQRQGHVRLLRRGSILASLVFVVALTATLLPKMLVWRALAQMANASEQAKSMHSVKWAIEADGTRRKIQETWFQAGRW